MIDFPVKRNLRALYVVKIAKWMNLVMPVIVLFYLSNDMSMQDIFTLKAIYSFTLMFFEIPTGYFADLVGRRVSILIGSVLGAAGYLIYSASGGFVEFVVAEVALGISMSLVSGADSAMLFDTLRAGGQTSEYTRVEGRITSAGNFAEAIAGIIGGLLAVISLRTPFIFQTAIAAIAIPAGFYLKEPPALPAHLRMGLRDFYGVIRSSLFGNRKLSSAVMLSAAVGVSTLTMAWFVQPYLIAAGLEVGWFGVAWAILNGTVGFAAYYAWRVEKRLGSKITILAIVAALGAGFLGMSLLPLFFGSLMLMIFHVFRGVATPTLRNYINLLTESGVRATVLSVRNFMIRMIFAILGPFLGFLTDAYNLKTALLIAGLLFSLMCAAAAWYFIRHASDAVDQQNGNAEIQ